MKNEDKQFDDFLRSRFEYRTFEQKDKYWTNAQELISEHRKSQRGRGILAFTFSAMVLVALSAALLWKNNTGSPEASAQGTQEQSYTAQVNPNPVNNIHTANGAANENSSNTLAVNAGTSRHHHNGHSPHASAARQSKQHNNGTSHNADNTHNTAKGSSVAVLASYTPSAGNTLSSGNAPGNTNASIAGHNRAADKAAATKASKGKRYGQHKFAGNNIAADGEALDGEAKRNEYVTSLSIGSRIYKPLAPGRVVADTFNKKAALLDYTVREQKSFLTVEAGLNYYNPGSKAFKPLNVHAGLRYYYFVSPKVGLSAGLGYSRIHQNAGTRTYKDVDYGFGQKAIETRITTQRLDYIELPLDVHYRVSGNHFATVGAMAAYAIQAGEYVEYSAGGTNGTRSNSNLSAVNKLDLQLHLGYNYLLNNRYTFSAGYYFGLMDVSKNTAFKSDQFDRNSGIRITLGYKLF